MNRKGVLHHIELYVSDLRRSSEFWKWFLENLGYEQFQKWDAGISFKLGDTYIVFVQTEARFLDVAYHRCRTGINHLAFHAESRAHVEQLTKELKLRGVPILYQERSTSASKQSSKVFFEDPDRIKVEVVAPSE